MTSALLDAALGHARGAWMAQVRRAAFRARYDREPVFTSTCARGEADDFVLACRLAGPVEELYARFAEETRARLLCLPKDDRVESR